jgi:hypothetical protein
MPDGSEVLRIGAQFDVGALQSGMTQGAAAVATGTEAMSVSFDEARAHSEALEASLSESMRASSREITEARHAMHGFGEEIGIHVPRFVQSFVAEIGGVGPLLATAFTPIAIVGLASVLADAGKKAYDFYQDVYNLKSSFEELDAIEEKVAMTQLDLSNSIGKYQSELVKLKEGGVVGAKAELSAMGTEIVNISGQFDMASKKFTDMPKEVQAAFKEHTIFPAADIGKQIDEVTQRIKELKRAQAELADDPQPSVFGPSSLDSVNAQLQAYNTLLEALTPKQAELSAQMAVTTERLSAEMEQFSKSGYAAAQSTIKSENKPPDISALMGSFNQVSQITAGEVDLLKAIPPTAEQVYAQLADAAVTRYKEIQKEAEETMRAQVRSAQETMAASDRSAEAQYKAGVITIQQLDAAKQAALDKEYQQEQVALTQRLNTLGPKEVEEREKVLDELRQLDQKYHDESAQFAQQDADGFAKSFEKSFNQITGSFNQNIVQWINGSERFGQMVQRSWTSLADSAISNMLKMAENDLRRNIEARIQAEMTATSQAAASSQGAAIVQASALKQQFALAKSAAAGAYNAMVNIPIIGPELGAVAAATTFAAIMAFEKGGIVPKDDIAMLHKNELVLPANIATHVMQTAGGEGGGQSGHTFNYNPTIHGSSDASVKDMLDTHGKMFVDYAMRQMRRMNYT